MEKEDLPRDAYYDYEFHCYFCDFRFFPWQVLRDITLKAYCPICKGKAAFEVLLPKKISTTTVKRSTTRSHVESH